MIGLILTGHWLGYVKRGRVWSGLILKNPGVSCQLSFSSLFLSPLPSIFTRQKSFENKPFQVRFNPTEEPASRLHSTALHCNPLHSLHFSPFHYLPSRPHCTAVHSAHSSTIHCTLLQCTPLHSAAICCTALQRCKSYSPQDFVASTLTLKALRGWGGGGFKLTPLDFFGFKFMLLDRLSKALVQLFLVC